jgi:hypothetical protein
MRHVADIDSRAVHSAGPIRAACLLVAVAMLMLPGCVRRRLNVRTNPPGALVYVDNQQIGTTPCSVDFTYYGTREIRLIKPGYETLTVNQPIPTPWYQFPPIDFVSENLAPMKIRDNRTVTYNLSPSLVVPKEQLLERANQLRQDTLQFPVQPAGVNVVVPPGAAPTMPTVVVPSGTMPQPPVAQPVAPVFAPPPSSVPFPPPAPLSGGTMVIPP